MMTRIDVGHHQDDYAVKWLHNKHMGNPVPRLMLEMDELEREISERRLTQEKTREDNPEYIDSELAEMEEELEALKVAFRSHQFKEPHVATHKPGTDSADRVGDIMFDEVGNEHVLLDRRPPISR